MRELATNRNKTDSNFIPHFPEWPLYSECNTGGVRIYDVSCMTLICLDL